MNYDKMFLFVKKTLDEGSALKPKNSHHQFRDRYKHTYRVFLWVDRLKDDFPNCDLEVLKTAAIFHDVGYACDKENHASCSRTIFLNYVDANKNEFSKEFVDKVSYLIANHSNKELIKTTDNIELILLLEADLLDEEGAMGILWDLLAKGHKGINSYEEALDEINKHSIHILDQDYMITPLAKKYWERKKELVKNFVLELKKDLFLE